MYRLHGGRTCDFVQKSFFHTALWFFCKDLDPLLLCTVATGWAGGGRGLWKSNQTKAVILFDGVKGPLIKSVKSAGKVATISSKNPSSALMQLDLTQLRQQPPLTTVLLVVKGAMDRRVNAEGHVYDIDSKLGMFQGMSSIKTQVKYL